MSNHKCSCEEIQKHKALKNIIEEEEESLHKEGKELTIRKRLRSMNAQL
jgi:hypothetical protein